VQLQRVSWIGPEGLGDLNDVDDDDEEEEEEEEETIVQEEQNENSPSQRPIPEKAILSKEAVNVVSALAAVARDCLLSAAESGIISNTHTVIQALQVPLPENELPKLDSRAEENLVFLAALATRCQRAEVLEAQAHLSYWLSVLTFACQMNRYVYLSSNDSLINRLLRQIAATKEAKYGIFNKIIGELKKSGSNNLKHNRTLDRYFQDGLTTAQLCGAGSFYMLILISCSRIRPEVRKIRGPMCGRIAKLIRCPPGECFIIVLFSDSTCWTDSAIGRKVTRHIIPAVAHLRQLYPISLKMILPLESLGLEHLTDTVNCQDILSCDNVFDTFQYK
jgi:hypothetical protein